MNVLIIQHADVEGPGVIENYLNRKKIPYGVFHPEKKIRLPSIDDWSHIVILGGPMNVDEEDRYPFMRQEDLFIKESIQRGKRVLGICLGAQLIAKALGAKVYRAPVKEVGWYDVEVTGEGAKDALFSRFPRSFPVFQWHGDTFDLPRAGVLLAKSSLVLHQAFRYGENVYGLQFHLEVTWNMIQEWMKTYEEELNEFQPSLSARILAESEIKTEACRQRGMEFFKRFFSTSGSQPFTF